MKDNFNHRKWFKDQYLKEAPEANINEKSNRALYDKVIGTHFEKGNDKSTSTEEAFKAILDVAANMKGKMDDHYIELLGKAHDSLRAEMDDLKRDAISSMMNKERGA